MPNLLEVAGAPKTTPSRFATIDVSRWFSGVLSNRSPFQQGESREQSRFFGGSPDVLWSGLNVEISASGKLIRRPGFTAYSSASLGAAAQSFYSFKNLSRTIDVMASTGAAVYKVTNSTATSIFTKSAGASATQFLTIGNNLFGCDGASSNFRYDGTTVCGDGIFAPSTAPTLSFASAGAVWKPNTAYAVNDTITDPNGNLQQVTTAGTSGSAAPSWSLGATQTTTDGPTLVWTNNGANASHGVFEQTGATYGYCYYSTATGHYSTMSPASGNTGAQANQDITVGGDYSTDPQVDRVAVFRTPDGGSTWLWIQDLANNTAGGTWSWVDTNLDAALNPLIVAPIADANNPAPVFQCQAYHAGRRWGAAGNLLYFSGGPDTTTGNGNVAFPPLNVFTFKAKIMALVPRPNGLLVLCQDSIYAIAGVDTTSFFPTELAAGVGIENTNAVCTDAGVTFLFTSKRRLLALDGRGLSDVGFNIADQLANVDPTAASVTVHTAGSNDHALFICDGSANVWRLNPSQAPEGNACWSPAAQPVGGASVIASIETSLGVQQLLLGQSAGTVLYRDWTSWTDAGSTYAGNAVLGSIVLSPPGEQGEVRSLIVEDAAVGTTTAVGVLFDEISGSFTSLPIGVSDPPGLPASTSIRAQRYYCAQAQKPYVCRHMQIQLSFAAEAQPNQIYSLSIQGATAAP